jgi:carbamoyl-phosphate synthase large subunit
VGTLPVVSSPEVIDLCFDKLATFDSSKLASGGRGPTARLEDAREALAREELSFPLLLKPAGLRLHRHRRSGCP